MNNLPYTWDSAQGSCRIHPPKPSCSSCVAGTVGNVPSAAQQVDYCPDSAAASLTPCLQHPIDQNVPGSKPVGQM